MKKLFVLILTLALVFSLSACKSGGSKSESGNSPASDSASTSATSVTSISTESSLTLAALKQAAKDAGFIVDDGTANDSNGKAPDPISGVWAGLMIDGSDNIVVYILEFASADDALAYKWTMDNAEIMINHTHACKQFCVEFHDEAYYKESELMSAFAALGWVDDLTPAPPSETSAPPPIDSAHILTTSLTLDQVNANAQAAGYTTDDGRGYVPDGPATPANGFEFKHPNLTGSVNVLEFASGDDALAYAAYAKNGNGDSWIDYVQGNLVLEFSIWPDDKFTPDMESQLVSALFK